MDPPLHHEMIKGALSHIITWTLLHHCMYPPISWHGASNIMAWTLPHPGMDPPPTWYESILKVTIHIYVTTYIMTTVNKSCEIINDY